eukprot:m.300261 g.300261  ORF g.300261 m.300261 type:complete len:272 (-) comp14402_c0_seq1:74-889(-)
MDFREASLPPPFHFDYGEDDLGEEQLSATPAAPFFESGDGAAALQSAATVVVALGEVACGAAAAHLCGASPRAAADSGLRAGCVVTPAREAAFDVRQAPERRAIVLATTPTPAHALVLAEHPPAPADARAWTAALVAALPTAAQIIVLCEAPLSRLRAEVIPEGPVLFSLASSAHTNEVLAAVAAGLSAPNVIDGPAAALVEHGEVAKRPVIVFASYRFQSYHDNGLDISAYASFDSALTAVAPAAATRESVLKEVVRGAATRPQHSILFL